VIPLGIIKDRPNWPTVKNDLVYNEGFLHTWVSTLSTSDGYGYGTPREEMTNCVYQ